MCLRDCSEYRGPTGPVFELCVRSDTSPFEVKLILMCKTCNFTHLLPYTSYTLVSYTSGFFLHIKRTYTLVSYTSSPDLHIMSTYTLVSYTLRALTHWCLTHYLPTYTLRVLTHGRLTHHYPTYTLSFVFD